jgi:GT2 family glycosyltransferase
VVVDGSEDGSAEALRKMDVPFSLIVLEQPNRGRAVARNRGASVARGEILLFLDDDMEAHPRLLTEHDLSHREGADVVLGHIPLHPKSPSNFRSADVKRWADERAHRLSSPNARPALPDLLTGQISLGRTTFHRVGGFDTSFTRDGSFGNEDIDFGYRLLLRGLKIMFNPAAISWQNYVVQPRQDLHQSRQAGHADVAFARKHPEQAKMIFALHGCEKWTNRWIWRPVVDLPLLNIPLTAFSWLGLRLAERFTQSPAVAKLFYQAYAMEYWSGVQEAGGMPRPWPLLVLAYHAIRDLAETPMMKPFGMPPELFGRQLDTLDRKSVV